MERAAAAADDATRGRMAHNFQRACDLEWLFWAQALREEAWPAYARGVVHQVAHEMSFD